MAERCGVYDICTPTAVDVVMAFGVNDVYGELSLSPVFVFPLLLNGVA